MPSTRNGVLCSPEKAEAPPASGAPRFANDVLAPRRRFVDYTSGGAVCKRPSTPDRDRLFQLAIEASVGPVPTTGRILPVRPTHPATPINWALPGRGAK